MNDLELVRDLLADRPSAWSELARRYQATLVETTRCLSQSQAECETLVQGFWHSLHVDPRRVFGRYNPRSTLQRYLTTCLANHCVPQMLGLIRSDIARGFSAFHGLFGPTLRRAVRHYVSARRSFMDGRTVDDIYHDVLTHLLEDKARRLLAYDGKGAFSSYLRELVQHYWVDSVREDLGRRRLPRRVQALPLLEQALFRLMAWDGLSAHEAVEQVRLTIGANKMQHELHAAVEQIIPHIPPPSARGAEFNAMSSLPDPDPDIVSGLLRWQRTRSPQSELSTQVRRRELDDRLEQLREAIRTLPDEPRVYLSLRYLADTPLTPREIAHRSGHSIESVYDVGRRAIAALRGKLVELGLGGLEA